jgi:hypothetical protein
VASAAYYTQPVVMVAFWFGCQVKARFFRRVYEKPASIVLFFYFLTVGRARTLKREYYTGCSYIKIKILQTERFGVNQNGLAERGGYTVVDNSSFYNPRTDSF